MSEARPSRARRHDRRLASVSGPACDRSLGRGGLAERHIDLGEGLGGSLQTSLTHAPSREVA